MKHQTYKLLRFGNKISAKHKRQINKLELSQRFIKIYNNQKPHLAMLYGDKIVSCLWLEDEEDEREFSVVTIGDHERKGLATQLITELVNDAFSKKIKEQICCIPIHPSIKKIVKRLGFEEEYKNSGTWYHEL